MAFVHKSIAHHCSVVTSAAVATGAGNTLGNKGGVAVYMKIANTRILIVNAHLAAHQNAERQRNQDYFKICRTLPQLLSRKSEIAAAESGQVKDALATSVSSSSSDVKSSAAATNRDVKSMYNEQKVVAISAEATVAVAALAGSSTSDVLSAVKTRQQLEDEIARAHSEGVAAGVAADPGTENALTATAGAVAVGDDGEEDGDEVEGVVDVTEVVEGAPDLSSATFATRQPGTSENSLSIPQRQQQAETEERAQDKAAVTTTLANAVAGSLPLSLEQCADAVVFMGDLNYRIKGNRSAVMGSLTANMHDVLLHNDQLR